MVAKIIDLLHDFIHYWVDPGTATRGPVGWLTK